MNRRLWCVFVWGTFLLLTSFGVSPSLATITNGLVLYHAFEIDEGGMVTDESGAGNDGTVQGATHESGGACVGGAYAFDGSDDSIVVPDDSSLRVQTLTVSAWIRPAIDMNDGVQRVILSKEKSGSPGGYYLGYRMAGGMNGLDFKIMSSGSYHGTFYETDLASDTYYHVAGTYDGAVRRLYLNGELKVAITNAAITLAHDAQSLYIGAQAPGTGAFWDGDIDEVRIYDRALSAGEITNLYGECLNEMPPSEDLVLYQSFETDEGGVVTDQSGAGNDGTVQGAMFDNFGACVGGMYSFDGGNDSIVVPDDASLRVQMLTMAAWVRPSIDMNDGGQRVIVSKETSGSPGGYYLGYTMLTNGQIGLNFMVMGSGPPAPNPGYHNTVFETDLVADTYYHVAGTYDGVTRKIYVNGELKTAVTNTPIALTHDSESVYVGVQAPGTQGFWEGDIDEVQIYNYALGAVEVSNLYQTCLDSPTPTNNPVLYYSFAAEEAGTVTDQSVAGNDGTVQGALFVTPGACAGGAYSFDGGGDHIITPDAPSLRVQTMSMAAWVKPAIDVNDGAQRVIVSKERNGFPGGYYLGYTMLSGGAKGLNFKIMGTEPSSSADYYSTMYETDLLSCRYYHIVGTYDGQVRKIYVNGGLKVAISNAPISLVHSAESVYIGAQTSGTGGFWDGDIDEVQVYDYALSHAEISNLYETCLAGQSPPSTDLDMTILADQNRIDAGGRLTYTVEAQNVGFCTATGIEVIATAPAQSSVVVSSLTTNCVLGPADTITCTVGTLAAGGSTTFTYQVDVDIGAVNSLTGIASVVSSGIDTNPANDSAEVVTLVHDPDFRDFDPVLYFPFTTDQGSNVINEGTGFVTAIADGAAWNAGGYYGGGLAFDGINDFVSLLSAPALGPTSFTFSAWINSLDYSENVQVLFATVTGNSNDGGFTSTIGGFDFRTAYGGQSGFVFTEAANVFDAADNGTWHFVAAAYGHTNGTATGKLYVDGALAAERSYAESPIAYNGQTGFIGDNYDTGADREFFGTLDEIRLHHRVLSQAEILQLMDPATLTADVGVTIQADDNIVEPGGRLTYTVNAENLGPFTATGVTITATAPAQSSVVVGSLTNCILSSADTISCTVGTFAVGATTAFTYQVDVDIGAAISLTGSALIASATVDANPENDQAVLGTLVCGPSECGGDPVLYLPFDDDLGGVITNGGWGAISGTANGATYSTDGFRGGAYEFDGNDDSLLLTPSPDLGPSEVTLAAWVRSADHSRNVQVVIATATGNKADGGFTMQVGSFDLRAGFLDPVQAAPIVTAPDVFTVGDNGEWRFVTATYGHSNGTSTVKLYVDGNPVHSQSYAAAPMTYNDQIGYIGDNFDAAEQREFFGTIDEVRMFDHVLSGGEVLALYRACGTAICPSIGITKVPSSQYVVPGGNAEFTITVTNSGGVALSNVLVTDASAPGCDLAVGDLAVGASTSYLCSVANVLVDFTNVIEVVGTPPEGPDVSAMDVAVVDVIHPSIGIAKGPSSQQVVSGSPAEFAIAVINTGDVTLHNVTVTDALAPDCDLTIGALAAGASTSYVCSVANALEDFTNIVEVVGTPPAGSDVSAMDVAAVDVIHPSIGIGKVAWSPLVTWGHNAEFIVRVTNTGDVALSNVMVTDALVPDCDLTIGALAVGASTSYVCSVVNVLADFTNVAEAVGTPPVGPDVTAMDEAIIDVIRPSIGLGMEPPSQSVSSGGTAEFTIAVTNTGDVVLNNVTVTDALAPDCDLTIGALAAGASTSYVCSAGNVSADFTNRAQVVGTPPVGADVSAMDEAVVLVQGPAAASNRVLCLDGSDSWGAVPDSPSLSITNTGMSMAAWIKRASSAAMDGGVGAILDNADAQPSVNGGFHLSFDDRASVARSDSISAVVSGGGAERQMWADNAILDDQWHHVVVVDDPVAPRIYVDGAAQIVTTGTYTAGAIVEGTQELTIGRFGPFFGGAGMFDGYIDNLSIWDRPLTDCEVEQIEWRALLGNEPGLVAYYNFDQAGAIVDQTANANDGALNGNAFLLADVTPTIDELLPARALVFETGLPTTGAQLEYAESIFSMTWTPSGDPLHGASGLSFFDGLHMIPHKIWRLVIPGGGPVNHVGVFDGSDSWITVPDSTSLSITNTGMAVSAWVKRASVTAMAGLRAGIFDKSDALPGSLGGYHFEFDDRRDLGLTNSVRAVFSGGTSGLDVRQYWLNGALVDTNWHHVIFVDDPAGVRLYFDGEPRIASTGIFIPGAIPDGTETLFVGRLGLAAGDSTVFDGCLDEVAIWSHPLSEAEVAGIQWGRLSGAECGLAALYGFNEPGAFPDDSGNGNAGTLVGTTAFEAEDAVAFSGINDAVEAVFVPGFPTTRYQLQYATGPAFTNWTGASEPDFVSGPAASIFGEPGAGTNVQWRILAE